MGTHKWLRCKSSDDVLVVKRSFFEACDQPIKLPCKHPHLIVYIDNLDDMTFEDKEKVKEMLDES